MLYYPVFLDIKDKDCLVIGGGKVAERKVLTLIEAGAKVTVLSPKLTPALEKLAKGRKTSKIRHIKGNYKPGLIQAYSLVISASSSKVTNKKASSEAQKLKIPVNVVDEPKLCSFILPSIIKRGDVVIAISSSGKSPLLSKILKESLDAVIPAELARYAAFVGAVRNKLLKEGKKSAIKIRLYKGLFTPAVFEMFLKRDRHGVTRYIKKRLGLTLKGLGLKLF